MPLSLLDIPEDILPRIFTDLNDLYSIVACELTCRTVRRIVMSDISRVYIKECLASGYAPSTHTRQTAKELLVKLRNRVCDVWEKEPLVSKTEVALKLEGLIGLPSLVREKLYYCHAGSDPYGIPICAIGEVDLATGETCQDWFTSSLPGWRRNARFTIDEEQDLLVWVDQDDIEIIQRGQRECCLWIECYSLATRKVHSLAAKALKIKTANPFSGLFVSGSVVYFKTSNGDATIPQDEIFAINWRTGAVTTVNNLQPPPTPALLGKNRLPRSFTLISKNILVTALANCINVAIPSDAAAAASCARLQLKYPPLVTSTGRDDDVQLVGTWESSGAFQTADPLKRTLISLLLSDVSTGGYIGLVLHRDELRRYLEKELSSPISSAAGFEPHASANMVVPWADWGRSVATAIFEVPRPDVRDWCFVGRQFTVFTENRMLVYRFGIFPASNGATTASTDGENDPSFPPRTIPFTSKEWTFPWLDGKTHLLDIHGRYLVASKACGNYQTGIVVRQLLEDPQR